MKISKLTRDSTEVTYFPTDKRQKPYTVQISEMSLAELEAILRNQVLKGGILPSLVTDRITELFHEREYNDR